MTVRLEIGYSSYRVSISSVSVEVRVECQSVSGCHRLLIGSVFGYRSGLGFFFLIEFGYVLLTTIDRINISHFLIDDKISFT